MKNPNDPPKKSVRDTRYTASRYNHFFPMEDGCLAYNAFSNSLAKVPPENIDIIDQILKDPGLTLEDDRSIKIKNDLIRGGFLIDHHLDEFDVLKVQNMVGRFANRQLSLTIAPTLHCNFSCSYCFEDKKPDTMTPEIEEALLKFVDNELKSLKSLNIGWFGGEPLLRIDTIERLTAGFETLCREHDAVFHPGSIITNGYLLTGKNAEKLKKANIRHAQVTLDGTAAQHDQRRKLINGKGTFREIVGNIKEAVEMIAITVRVNIDKDNVGQLDDFLEFWQKEGLVEKANFYYGQVLGNTAACSDIAGRCLSTREYSQLVIELLFKAINHGIRNIRYPSLYKTGFCGADNLNSYVVSPSGNLFKCWEEISAEEDAAIGHLLEKEPGPSGIANAARYLGWDPFSNDFCKPCTIFPVCGGGCIFNAMKSPEKKVCNTWKYNLKEMLLLKSVELASARTNGGDK